MSARKPIRIFTGRTKFLKDEGSPYPTALVHTSKGLLLVMVIGKSQVRVRTLERGDQEIIGEHPQISTAHHYLDVNGVELAGHTDLRPTGWKPPYPCSLSRNTQDKLGWLQRRYDEMRWHRRGESSWSAKGRPSISARHALRDLCQRAASHVLHLFPTMTANGSIRELENEATRLGKKLDEAYLRVDELTEEYAEVQEKLGAAQGNTP